MRFGGYRDAANCPEFLDPVSHPVSHTGCAQCVEGRSWLVLLEFMTLGETAFSEKNVVFANLPLGDKKQPGWSSLV